MMSKTSHKDCYGCVFPESLISSATGKVFSIEHPCRVGGVGRLRASVQSSDEQWDDCVSCDEFDHCYAYSVAKLLLEASVPRV